MKGIKKFLYYSTTFIIFVSVLYYSGNFILNRYYLEQYNAVNKNIVPVKITSDIVVIDETNKEINDNQQTNNTISKSIKTIDDYRGYYNNMDIVGKLSILNTDFSILLVQTTNNSYYLNHLVNKDKNKLGATFVDYRVDLDDSNKINIYGHNNGNNSNSFNKLLNYLDKTYYEKYKLIQIETDVSIDIYEIFSIEVVSNNNHMQVSFSNIEWYLYRENIINNSIYDTNTSVDDISKMITLQTCTNTRDNEFLLIHGRKIES